jgi:hypothetical protein
VLAECFE